MANSPARDILEIVGGFVLLGTGLIGLVVPIMPGWPFIITGMDLLSRHFHWARRLWKAARRARVYLARRVRRRKLSATPSS